MKHTIKKAALAFHLAATKGWAWREFGAFAVETGLTNLTYQQALDAARTVLRSHGATI